MESAVEKKSSEVALDNLILNEKEDITGEITTESAVAPAAAVSEEEKVAPEAMQDPDNFESGLVEQVQVQSEEDSSQSMEATDEDEGPNYVYIKGTPNEPSGSTSSVAKVEVEEKHAGGQNQEGEMANEMEIAQEESDKSYAEMMQIGDVQFKDGVHYVVNDDQLQRTEDGEEIVVFQGYETADGGTTIVHIGEDGGSYYIEEMVDNPGK